MGRLVEAVKCAEIISEKLNIPLADLEDVFAEIPTADVVEVKHAYWKVCEDECEICASEFVCSNCKESFVSSDLTDEQFLQMLKYCPNCGAKMNGK